MSLTSTSTEALRLYRDCMRACKKFTWKNEKGQMWSDVLRTSVKKEFEQGRWETDYEVALRLIVTGREALNKTEEAMEFKRLKLLGFEGETMDDAVNNSDFLDRDSSRKDVFIRRK